VQIMTYFCHGPLLERLMGADPYSVDAMIKRRSYLVDQIVHQWRPGKYSAVKTAAEKGRTKRRAG